MKPPISITSHSNGMVVKSPNRRTVIVRHEDDTFTMEVCRVIPDSEVSEDDKYTENQWVYSRLGVNILTTSIRYTKESVLLLRLLLEQYFTHEEAYKYYQSLKAKPLPL